jgi:penicillin-binding protein 1C
MVLAAAPVLGWATFWAAVAWWPYPASLEAPPPTATWIADREARPLAAFAASDGQWRRPLTEELISPQLLQAIVAVEDARFYQHGGVDWASATAAVWEDAIHHSFRRGASTLTMQLERLRDPGTRTLASKLDQAVRACQIERRMSKGAILVEYVNRAPFGGNLVGAGAASWRYFGRSCAQLSLGQAALLAGLPQNPNRLRPDRYPSRALARRNHVLDRMFACSFITPRQRDQAAAEPLDATWHELPQGCDENALLPTLLRISRANSGPDILTTLDACVQRQAAAAATEHLRALAPSGVDSVAVVVLDTLSSELLAAVSLSGGGNDLDLTDRPRSTGSILKPLIYAAAFDEGLCAPATILQDAPAAWPGYVPANYDRQFRGPMAAADALAQSRNIPALLVLSRLGVEHATGVMETLGIDLHRGTARQFGLSLAIGGAEATPLEIACAYACLARGGTPKPIGVTHNKPDDQATSVAAIKPNACWQTLAALDQEQRTAPLSRAAADRHVAWKTGTSSGHRDAWCAAVTPRRTVVVWLGNTGGQGSTCLVGQEAAAPLALELIASLDPGGPTWPAPAPVAPIELHTPGEAALILVSPTPRHEVVLSPDVPTSQQQILLEAALTGSAQQEPHVWWFVDGRVVAEGALNQKSWWTPSAGTHHLRLVDAAGRAAEAQIFVRER